MRKLCLALAAAVMVLSTAAFTTRSDAMTLGVGSGLGAAIDAGGIVDQVHYYGYGGYYGGYRGYYGGYRGYYGGYRGYGYRSYYPRYYGYRRHYYRRGYW